MGGASGLVCFVGLEGHLQDSVPEAVAVEAGDGHGRLVIVSHGDEAEAFALVCVEVADDLDVRDGAERPEHLPQDALVGVGRQVVDEDAPARPRVARDVDARQAGHAVDGHRREAAGKTARVNRPTNVHRPHAREG